MAKTLIYKLHEQGKTIKEISEITHWSEKTISNVLTYAASNKLPIELITEEDKEIIKNKYINGISTMGIGKEYGITNHKVAHILDSLGIDRDNNSMRKYTLNTKYFDNINTPNKAYILGLLYADGHNSFKRGTIEIALEECDKHILEDIKKELNYKRDLIYIPVCKKIINGKEYDVQPQYKLQIFSSYMCESLICCGMIPNKSNRLKFPMYIPDELLSHFIRGYFDGNGTMGCKDINVWNRKTIQPKITSTYDFNISLSKYLKENLNIESKVVFSSNNNGITSDLCINKNSEKLKFCNWIYKDADMFLKRKHNIYAEYCNINNPDLSNEQIG